MHTFKLILFRANFWFSFTQGSGWTFFCLSFDRQNKTKNRSQSICTLCFSNRRGGGGGGGGVWLGAIVQQHQTSSVVFYILFILNHIQSKPAEMRAIYTNKIKRLFLKRKYLLQILLHMVQKKKALPFECNRREDVLK